MVLASLEIERATNLLPASSTDAPTLEARAQLTAAADEARHAAPTEDPELRLPSPDRGWSGARASVDAPVVLDPPRDVLVPAIPSPLASREPTTRGAVVPEPPRVGSIEELEAMLAQPAQLPRPPNRTERQRTPQQPTYASMSRHLERLAETMVEELGVFGLQRRQLAGQSWTGKARTETRLLARIDALVSCGPQVLPRLVRKLEARPVPDAELTWGLLFLFGCLSGDDAIDEALRVARASSLEMGDVREAVADAFALVPNVRIERRLRTWLTSARSVERSAAVHALGRRGAITIDELRGVLASAEPHEVREAALAIRSASGRIDERTMDWLLHHDDGVVVERAIASAVLRHDASGARRARALVRGHRGELGGAALVFALSEGRDALEPLLESAAVSGAPVVLAALGWFGHVGAVPYLIGRLESDDPATSEAAAAALARIAGVPGDDNELPRDAAVMAPAPCLDAKRWRRWWRRHERRVDARIRYRFGAPWSVQTNVRELEHDATPKSSRFLAHLELVARSGITAPFDADAFVARQRVQLEMIHERVSAMPAGMGAWPVHLPI